MCFPRAFLTLTVLLLVASPAFAAAPLDAARQAFAQGDFARAATLAHEVDAAEGEALAARAELAEGDFVAQGEASHEDFRAAVKSARRAILLDPRNVEGHLYLALALGFLGRIEGSVTAHLAGYAEEARRHIDQALELAPTDPWANALLGGWNLEIVNDGGVFGEVLYGASRDRGIAAYNYALALDPGNAAIAYQYALQLVAMGGAWPRAEAYQVLKTSIRTDPTDAFQRLAWRRAERMMLALESRDDRALRAIMKDPASPLTAPTGATGKSSRQGVTGLPR